MKRELLGLLGGLSIFTLFFYNLTKDIKFYDGTYNGYDVRIASFKSYNQLNIYDTTKDCYVSAKDFNKDGIYDHLETFTLNKNLLDLANIDSINAIHQKTYKQPRE